MAPRTDTWQDWLTQTLPAYLQRDPLAIPAILLTPPADAGPVVIAQQTLTLGGAGRWDLTQYTLGTLATAIAASGWGATVVPGILTTLAATTLIDTGTSRLSPVSPQAPTPAPVLAIPGSVLWQAVRPLAHLWDTLWASVTPLLMGQLTGPWLDALGEYLQVPRIGGEPDALYRARIDGLAITGSPNAVAIETFLAALGYSVTVATTTPGAFAVTVQWPVNPPAGFVYSQTEVAGMVATLKAAGVIATVVFAAALQDTAGLADAATLTATTLAALVWGGSLPDGTGAVPGLVWNQGGLWR
jgi:hypothetical protein